MNASPNLPDDPSPTPIGNVPTKIGSAPPFNLHPTAVTKLAFVVLEPFAPGMVLPMPALPIPQGAEAPVALVTRRGRFARAIVAHAFRPIARRMAKKLCDGNQPVSCERLQQLRAECWARMDGMLATFARN